MRNERRYRQGCEKGEPDQKSLKSGASNPEYRPGLDGRSPGRKGAGLREFGAPRLLVAAAISGRRDSPTVEGAAERPVGVRRDLPNHACFRTGLSESRGTDARARRRAMMATLF